MIEFKAECGHTVRAKDEDAGGVVRCTYCGRNTAVPDNRNADLDFLLSEIPAPREDGETGRRRRRRRSLFRRRARMSSRFDVFSLIFRMCYVAALIAIVIVVARLYVIPLFEEGVGSRVAQRPGADARQKSTATPPATPTTRRTGLSTLDSSTGLYVGSTPPGASVFCVEASKAPPKGRIHQIAGATQSRANGPSLRVSDGAFVVEVAMAWNDPALNDPDLPTYQQYLAFRRAVENAQDDERARLVESFFVPDEASAIFVDQTAEQIFLVRQYRNVEVRNGQSNGVQALFLPRIPLPGRDAFSIAQLVTHYLPKDRAYNFNEKQVRSELEYYKVPDADRLFVIEALSRIGAIPYVTPDGRTRLFKIGLHDGMFTTKVIREAKE